MSQFSPVASKRSLDEASVAWMKRSEIQESVVRPGRTLQESQLTLAPYVKNVKDNKRALRIDVFGSVNFSVMEGLVKLHMVFIHI